MPLLLSHDLYLKHVCYVLFSKYSKKYQFVLYASRSRETGAVQQVGCGGYGVVLEGRKRGGRRRAWSMYRPVQCIDTYSVPMQ